MNEFVLVGLTIVRHPHRKALLEAAILALVAVLLLDLAVALTLVIVQLQADSSSEETLKAPEQSVILRFLF